MKLRLCNYQVKLIGIHQFSLFLAPMFQHLLKSSLPAKVPEQDTKDTNSKSQLYSKTQKPEPKLQKKQISDFFSSQQQSEGNPFEKMKDYQSSEEKESQRPKAVKKVNFLDRFNDIGIDIEEAQQESQLAESQELQNEEEQQFEEEERPIRIPFVQSNILIQSGNNILNANINSRNYSENNQIFVSNQINQDDHRLLMNKVQMIKVTKYVQELREIHQELNYYVEDQKIDMEYFHQKITIEIQDFMKEMITKIYLQAEAKYSNSLNSQRKGCMNCEKKERELESTREELGFCQKQIQQNIIEHQKLQEEFFDISQKIAGIDLEVERRLKDRTKTMEYESLKNNAASLNAEYMESIETLNEELQLLSQKCKKYEGMIVKESILKERQKNIEEKQLQIRVKQKDIDNQIIKIQNQFTKVYKRESEMIISEENINKKILEFRKKQNQFSKKQKQLEEKQKCYNLKRNDSENYLFIQNQQNQNSHNDYLLSNQNQINSLNSFGNSRPQEGLQNKNKYKNMQILSPKDSQKNELQLKEDPISRNNFNMQFVDNVDESIQYNNVRIPKIQMKKHAQEGNYRNAYENDLKNNAVNSNERQQYGYNPKQHERYEKYDDLSRKQFQYQHFNTKPDQEKRKSLKLQNHNSSSNLSRKPVKDNITHYQAESYQISNRPITQLHAIPPNNTYNGQNSRSNYVETNILSGSRGRQPHHFNLPSSNQPTFKDRDMSRSSASKSIKGYQVNFHAKPILHNKTAGQGYQRRENAQLTGLGSKLEKLREEIRKEIDSIK